MVTGRKLATYLRVGVKQNYGNRSEKLVEFGLQPLRIRRKAADTQTPNPEPAPTAPVTTNPVMAKPAASTETPAPAGSGH